MMLEDMRSHDLRASAVIQKWKNHRCASSQEVQIAYQQRLATVRAEHKLEKEQLLAKLSKMEQDWKKDQNQLESYKNQFVVLCKKLR